VDICSLSVGSSFGEKGAHLPKILHVSFLETAIKVGSVFNGQPSVRLADGSTAQARRVGPAVTDRGYGVVR
jgi:hypothetical protein